MMIGKDDGIRPVYDFVVCGAGSAGCVVARRLAEHPDVTVLLLEAGGDDNVPTVMDPSRWTENIGSERDWGFKAQPNQFLNNRALPLSMGKVLGGGSSINGLMWMRGHKEDWDFLAEAADDPGWNYDATSLIYARVEKRRGGSGDHQGDVGHIYIEPSNPRARVPLLVDAAQSLGLPIFDTPNGELTRSAKGAAPMDVIVENGRRLSVYQSYIAPVADRSNLDVVTGATITRLRLSGTRIVGVRCERRGRIIEVSVEKEVVLSLGAINTPKLLFQSGIGDASELKRVGLPVVSALPGVGRNLQDHVLMFGMVWEIEPRSFSPNESRAVLQCRSDSLQTAPDIQIIQSSGGGVRAAMRRENLTDDAWWSLAPGIIQPRSRGFLRFRGPDPDDPVEIHANHLSDSEDMKAAVFGIEMCRDLGCSKAIAPYVKRELMPGGSKVRNLREFIRNNAVTYWHQSCTAKMGRDTMSVVDSRLRVYGVDNLRIADASILPRITAGNTMAPCVVVGERAGEMMRRDHSF